MSRCGTFRRWCSAAHDGELAAPRRATLDAHLESCDDCRSFRDGLGRLDAVLGTLPLAAQDRGELPVPVPAEAWAGRFLWVAAAWGLHIAVSAVVMTGVLVLYAQASREGEPVRPIDITAWIAAGLAVASAPLLYLLAAAPDGSRRREAWFVAGLIWLGSVLYEAWAVPAGWASDPLAGLKVIAPVWQDAAVWGAGALLAGLGCAFLVRARGVLSAFREEWGEVVSGTLLRLAGAASVAVPAAAAFIYRGALGVFA